MATTIEHARAIMGNSFCGIEVVENFCGVRYTADQLKQLQGVPFCEAVLHECKDTHLLIPGYPMSILELQAKFVELFKPHSFHDKTFFRVEKVSNRWYLLRKKPLPRSEGVAYPEQLGFLSDNEEVPTACEVTYMVVLHYLMTNRSLLMKGCVRCRDKGLKGRVLVGSFGYDHRGLFGLYIDWLWDEEGPSPSIGLAASRKT